MISIDASARFWGTFADWGGAAVIRIPGVRWGHS